ncbi:MAG TPA: FtsW/RodA/SpoVE family cell cycle protein [Patescibacteria group bacterium]
MKRKALSHTNDRQLWKRPDNLLLTLTIMLAFFGLFFIFEASSSESFRLVGHQYHFLKQQAISLSLGLGALVGALILPSTWWEKTAHWWLWLGFLLLVLVLVPSFGVELNGARRWFAIQDRVFQPVEFFKLSLILFYARWLTTTPKVTTFLLLTVVFSSLLLLQPDLGSLLILLAISLGLFFLAGGRLLALAVISLAGGLLLFLLIISSTYRSQRLLTYLNPDLDPLGSGFHVRQITLALGSGGWFGVGIGNSQQKHAYIPEVSSDSIFAIIAEEVGFVGSMVIIGLLVIYLLTLYRIAISLPTGSFAQLFVFGVHLWLTSQILLNLAAVVALVPLTGLPLPFFSSGGSSLITILFVVGLSARLFRENQVYLPLKRKKVQ